MKNGDILIIPGSSKHLAEVRRFIDKNSRKCGFDENAVYDIKVATGEACSNAIEHGSPSGNLNKIEIIFKCEKSAATIIVKDEGKFKRRVIDYDANGIHHRGRGIDFILALMDEVRIKADPNGTVVEMKKSKPSTS